MANEKGPETDFGDGGVGSQKEGFVGTDRGIVSNEQRIPDENPTLMQDGGSNRAQGSGEAEEGQPNAGAGTDTRLLDSERHSGLSGGEASIGD